MDLTKPGNFGKNFRVSLGYLSVFLISYEKESLYGSARAVTRNERCAVILHTLPKRPFAIFSRPCPQTEALDYCAPCSIVVHSASTMREIVHIQAGQCGNQIGAKFWEVRGCIVTLQPQLCCQFGFAAVAQALWRGSRKICRSGSR